MGPTFLGIGAQKAGTTWLYAALETNREVFLPPVKELHYFDRRDPALMPTGLKRKRVTAQAQNADEARGLALYKGSRGRIARNAGRVAGHVARGEIAQARFYYRFLTGKRGDAWYGSLFDAKRPARGEITPNYALLSAPMIAHIAGLYPDLRVVYLLRNPVDRAWSLYRYARDRKGGQGLALEDFLARETASHHGRYSANIARWSGALAPGHLLVGYYDALVHRPEALIADICGHLGVGVSEVSRARQNASEAQDMPEDFRAAATRAFGPEIEALAAAHGGYAVDWAQGALVSDGTHPASVTL